VIFASYAPDGASVVPPAAAPYERAGRDERHSITDLLFDISVQE